MLRHSLFTGICAIALLAGCESSSTSTVPRTEGKLIKQGENLIADGKAQRARGEELRNQGKTVDGERLIGEGDAKIREGQALIDRAKTMPTEPQSYNTDRDMNR